MASPRRTERWFQQLVGGGDISRGRLEYASLREKHNTDPRGDSGDPLMATEGSTWASYFATQEVRKTIALDLERLHPGDPFYASGDVQAALLDILTVWSLENPTVGYRQGMHELASLVLSQRAADVNGLGHSWGHAKTPPTEPVIDGAPELSANYVEHDSSVMFSKMLGQTRAANQNAPNETTPIRVVCFFEDAPGKGGFDKSEVKDACDRVFNALGAVDPPLRQHLVKLGIEPQLFLLRWFRVLFTREFHSNDAMRVWSAFFAENESSESTNKKETKSPRDLIEAFAVAMVIFVRGDILASDDFGTCLRRLQKYPPVEDIQTLIERARAIQPVVSDPNVARVNIISVQNEIQNVKTSSDSLSPEMLRMFGGSGGSPNSAQTPGNNTEAAREAAREIFNKAKDVSEKGQKRAGELFKAIKSGVGSLIKDSDETGFRRQVSLGGDRTAEHPTHGEGFEIGERRSVDELNRPAASNRPIPIAASPGKADGIGIGWIGSDSGNKKTDDYRNVSLGDGTGGVATGTGTGSVSSSPRATLSRPPSTVRFENLKALEVSMANVTSVLGSGTVTDANVELSLRDVQASLTIAIAAMKE